MNGERMRDERNLMNFVNIFACQFIVYTESHWTVDDLFKSMRKRIKDHHFMDSFPKYLWVQKESQWRLEVEGWTYFTFDVDFFIRILQTLLGTFSEFHLAIFPVLYHKLKTKLNLLCCASFMEHVIFILGRKQILTYLKWEIKRN